MQECQIASSLERKAKNLENVRKVFTFLGSSLAVSGVFRIGTYIQNKIRPMKIVLQSEKDVHIIIRNTKKLRGATDYGNISVTFDRTPKQLSRYKSLQVELRERVASGESNLKLRYVSGVPTIVTLN